MFRTDYSQFRPHKARLRCTSCCAMSVVHAEHLATRPATKAVTHGSDLCIDRLQPDYMPYSYGTQVHGVAGRLMLV